MTDRPLIIYDGECVFCQNYVRLIRLREAVGVVDLVDARSDDSRPKKYAREGYDLNEGMLFVYQGRVHHGAGAVALLAALSSSSTWFNKLNRVVFSSLHAATLLYPLLRIGRNLTLALRGKDQIKQ